MMPCFERGCKRRPCRAGGGRSWRFRSFPRATSGDARHGLPLLNRLMLIIVAAGRTGGDVPLGVAGRSPGG
jgi:hypothetical protein